MVKTPMDAVSSRHCNPWLIRGIRQWFYLAQVAQRAPSVSSLPRLDAVPSSNIWPNGDGVAQRFILGMTVVWLGAIFPIVFVGAALGAFGVLELIRFGVWAADRFGKPKSSASA